MFKKGRKRNNQNFMAVIVLGSIVNAQEKSAVTVYGDTRELC